MSTDENKTETDGEKVARFSVVSLDVHNKRIVLRGCLGGHNLSFDDLCVDKLHKVTEALNFMYRAGVRVGARSVAHATDEATRKVIAESNEE